MLRIAITLVGVTVAVILVAALWRTYMLAPWTRDGRVLVQVVDIAPEVSGTVAELDVDARHRDDFVHGVDAVEFNAREPSMVQHRVAVHETV